MKPRQFMLEPQLFGKEGMVGWIRATQENGPRLLAAQIQHEHAVAIRRQMKQKYGSIEAYVAVTGQSADRVGKMLRGVGTMRLEDIAAARLYLGLPMKDPLAFKLHPDQVPRMTNGPLVTGGPPDWSRLGTLGLEGGGSNASRH